MNEKYIIFFGGKGTDSFFFPSLSTGLKESKVMVLMDLHVQELYFSIRMIIRISIR